MAPVILIWLVSGIVGAMIAQSKNRPPIQGAALGFLLGLVGVIIMACMSKREPTVPTAPSAPSL